jgi:hypothetical protein
MRPARNRRPVFADRAGHPTAEGRMWRGSVCTLCRFRRGGDIRSAVRSVCRDERHGHQEELERGRAQRMQTRTARCFTKSPAIELLPTVAGAPPDGIGRTCRCRDRPREGHDQADTGRQQRPRASSRLASPNHDLRHGGPLPAFNEGVGAGSPMQAGRPCGKTFRLARFRPVIPTGRLRRRRRNRF